jgi:hypothetical protein
VPLQLVVQLRLPGRGGEHVADGDPTARFADPNHVGEHAPRVGEVAERVPGDDAGEARVRERQGLGVALHPRQVRQPEGLLPVRFLQTGLIHAWYARAITPAGGECGPATGPAVQPTSAHGRWSSPTRGRPGPLPPKSAAGRPPGWPASQSTTCRTAGVPALRIACRPDGLGSRVLTGRHRPVPFAK